MNTLYLIGFGSGLWTISLFVAYFVGHSKGKASAESAIAKKTIDVALSAISDRNYIDANLERLQDKYR